MDLQLPISSIMTAPVECIDSQEKILVLKHLYERQEFHRHFPVVEDDSLVGMVSLIDYMRVVGEATLDDNEPVYSQTTIADIMSYNPVTVSEDTTISDVGKLLSRGEVGSVVVMNDDQVSGIVTRTDLIRYFLSFED